MDCIEVGKQLEAYADDELDAVASRGVASHVERCAGCREALARVQALRSLVRESAPYYVAPDGLANAIRGRAGMTRQSSARLESRHRWWALPVTRMAAVAAATALVTWLVTSYVHTSRGEPALVAQVISGHARAILTTHVTDVASSDQHTVKPWLSSKLDFSPPVTDLTTAGFQLVGGRLDYLDNRPVAALVYRHRQHVIDLFMWPDRSARAEPIEAFTHDGYQILHWRTGGMTYWAISDLNAGEMRTFAQTFAAAN